MIINGEQLTMIRGDSEMLEVSLLDADGEMVEFEDGDLVELTVRENINRKEKSLYKRARARRGESSVTILIYPEDTENLKAKDDYVYDIQLTQDGDYVTTIVGPDYFSLIGDVTRE